MQPGNLGNPDLAPEVSTEWEIGTEIGLFNDRASLDITYWDRTVTDALVQLQYPVTGGFNSPQLTNIGEVAAHGLEINTRGAVIQGENLTLNVFANAAYLQEEVTDMGAAPAIKTGGSYPRYRNYIVEGYAPGAFFGAEIARDLQYPINIDGSCTEPTLAELQAFFAGPVNPSNFKPLAIGNSDFGTPNGQLASHNCGTGLLDTYLGKPAPDWQGSFGFNMSFAGNWELAALAEFKAGNFYVHDLSGMFRRAHSVIGRNTPDAARLAAIMQNPASTPDERIAAADQWVREIEGLAPFAGTNGIKAADFVKFRELSLTYRVPSDFVARWGLNTATISVGARNFGQVINGQYPGMDPEGNVFGRCNGGTDCNFVDSVEGWGIPIPRRFTFSTRVTF